MCASTVCIWNSAPTGPPTTQPAPLCGVSQTHTFQAWLISRIHCQITEINGTLVVRDLGSHKRNIAAIAQLEQQVLSP